MTAPAAALEFARPLAADRVGRQPLEQRVEATQAECRAVAARLRIPEVLALSCAFTLRRDGGGEGTIAAQGALRARVVQDCVVTLEPFAADVTEDFDVRFVPAGGEAADEDDPFAPDEIFYVGGALDLGEAAVEQLALALDPFPRRPEAALPETALPEAVDEAADEPGRGALARALLRRAT